ncbi:MAG: carboxypeptidase regulatory-like domain-containing protein [Cyanobacteria bacterium SZAS LIN-3]|nr:carboxypeptidase regulatory-like domain-containing protein [Cyanobacteria bacterium SZAS LIN-3]
MALTEHTVNISGNVKHQGLSLAQVQVKLFDLYSCNFDQSGDPFVCLAETKTGSRGEFSFTVKPGVYRVEIIPDGKTRFLSQTLSEVKVMTNTSLNVSLATGCIVNGRVATGFGFEGNRSILFAACEVVALGIEPTSYKTHGSVNEDGTFSLIIPRGKYYFAIRSAQDNDAGETAEADLESIVRSAPPKFISTECQIFNVSGDTELTLGLPSFVSFKGEVVDLFGTAIAGANVVVVPAVSSQNVLIGELNMSARAVTGEDGQFELSLQEGLYDISIEPSTGSTHFAFKENEMQVSADQGTKISRKFVLEEGHRLKGLVQLNDQPLSQALVRVQSVERKNEYITRTDGQGEFALSLPAGHYKLIVSAHPKDAPSITIDGYEYSSLAPWTHSLVLGADTHLLVTLVEGTALIGRICDDALQARPGVRVQVFADHSTDSSAEGGKTPPDSASAFLATGITDGEGRYGLFLSPGGYWLVIHRDFANAKYVLVENDPVTLDITWHGWSQLTFEVVGEGGQTVPRCQVFYHPYGQEMDERPARASSAMPLPHGYVMTTEEGICRLTLPAGVYTFKFVPPEAGSFAPKVIRQLSISADISRRVTLDAKQSTAAGGARDGHSERA